MKLYLYLISFVLWFDCSQCEQPYFPQQIVFSVNNLTIYGIDEINQRAFTTYPYSARSMQNGFVMKNFTYAQPDSPQSKYYVLLSDVTSSLGTCQYETYWEYGGSVYDIFPFYWRNGTSYEIKNYLKFDYEMIHSSNSSDDEDYWYSNKDCRGGDKQIYPCQEIYFKKNTEIPLRYTEVNPLSKLKPQVIRNFTIISMGKPDEKYFDLIPKNWTVACRDANLELLLNPDSLQIENQHSSIVQLWLSTPPHRINGNDTVTLQWKIDGCNDCVTWTPKQIIFTDQNFHEKQNLTITRVKDGISTLFRADIHGGGFDNFATYIYQIYVY